MSPKFIKHILFVFFLISHSLFSQEKDSLADYSHKKLRSLYYEVMYEDTSASRVYLHKMLTNAKTTNNTYNVSETSILLAKFENSIGNYDKAIPYIESATQLAKSISNDNLEAQSLFSHGFIDYDNGNYDNAFDAYIKALSYYKKTAHKLMINSISHNIALIKSELGDQNGALDILLQNYNASKNVSREIRSKEFGSFFYTNTLITLSNVYVRKANKVEALEQKLVLLDSASIYNDIGFRETIKEDDVYGNIYFINGEAIISYEKGMFEKSIERLNESIEQIEKVNQPSLLTSAYYYKGLSYKELNKIDSTIVYLQKTDSISKKNSINYPTLQGVYYTLAEIYKEREDPTNVLKYQNLYIKNARINAHLTDAVRQDIHQKYDIAPLNSEIKALTNTTKKQKIQYTKAIIIIGVLLALLFVFFLFYKKQQQKNKVAFKKLMLTQEDTSKKEIPKEKKSTSLPIDDQKIAQVLKELDKFEEKKLFLDQNCDLAFVAKKVKINKGYLSKIIYVHRQQKFIDYIRSLRINYALKKLKEDKVFRAYDIKSIAKESGFKSSDSFSRAFVKNTGIYPSFYVKSINKSED